MRIMLVISSLRRGGAERVLGALAEHWAEQGHAVALTTFADRSPDEYPLHPGVNRITLDCVKNSGNPFEAVFNNLRRVRRLRAAAGRWRPDVVISFLTESNTRTLLAFLATRVPVIVSERVDPSQLQVGIAWNRLRSWLYPRAAVVVVQTEQVRAGMQRVLPHARFAVIPNPVPAMDPDREHAHQPVRERLGLPSDTRLISAMGRLELQKGFDLLVEAFSRAQTGHPDWHLVIFGEGSERPRLESLIARLDLRGRVHLPGQVQTVRGYLRETDLFVLSSRFEGFPNALLEAMACGLPVISFDCPSGPGEIIRDRHDGLLIKAGNVGALEAAISTLMESPVRRKELGENARQVLERFSPDRIMALWDQSLSRAIPSSTLGRI